MKERLQITSLALIVAICLFMSACSQQDHVIPELLAIKTENVTYNEGWDFTIQTDKLGDLPITEHGILHLAFFRGSTDTDYTPRIDHGAKIQFDTPLVLGANTFKYKGSAFAGTYFFYYRAYAIKSDGSVVYGEIKNYTF